MMYDGVKCEPMIRFLIPLLLFVTPVLGGNWMQGDLIDNVAGFFRVGNAKEIARYFNPSVELSIGSKEDVYSKAQAEQILREFFTKNHPSNAAIIHQINTNPTMRFAILLLQTRTGSYRVSVSSKKSGNLFLITELRIEQEK